MPKVVTSEGLTEFVQSGKFTTVAAHKSGSNGATPPPEVVKPSPTLDVKPADASALKADKMVNGEPEKPPVVEAEPDLTEEEKALPDKARKEIIRAKKAVNEKHRLMREAQEEAEAADRLAEQQFNERRLQQQRADAAEARLKELEAKANPPAPAPKEPVIDDYKLPDGNYDWLKFQKDTSEYTRKQALEDFRKEQAEENARKAQEARIAEMRASAAEARKAHPDFDEVMTALQGTDADNVPRFVLDFIEESKHSAEVAYFLAKNADVRERISKMTPRMGTAELGVIQAGLVKPPSAAPSPRAESVTPVRTNGGAPAPITPLDGEGSGGIKTDPSTMSFRELRAYHRAKEAEKRRH